MSSVEFTDEDRKRLEQWIRDGGTLAPLDIEESVEWARRMLVETACGRQQNRDLALTGAFRALIASSDEVKRLRRAQDDLTELLKQANAAVDRAQSKVTKHYLQRDSAELPVGVDFGKVRIILHEAKKAIEAAATEKQKEV